jgi:hypothetical protein
MSKNLHLIPKMPLTEGQKFDAGMGCLTLAKAGKFTVDITKRDGLHEGAPEKLDPFKRLTQEEVFAMPNIDDRKIYVADHKERDKKEAEYKKERDTFNEKLHEELATLSWCWETVQNGMTGKAMAHNPGQTKGLPKDGSKQFFFPEVLEGGGLVWLETFTNNDPATGKVPNGLFVRANGIPQIIRAVWTDLDCKPIMGKVKVGSKVLLNIYTKGLYGQDFEIGLWSQPTEKPETLSPINNKGNYRHEALTYKIQPNEENKHGVSGGLMVEGKSESRVQKIRIPVTVNPIWMFAQGKGLAIYHTIKHLDTGLYFKDYKAEAILDIGYDGVLHETVIEATNNPLLVGSVETNVANFNPCQYTELTLLDYNDKSTTIYKQDNSKEDIINLEIGIVGFTNPKKYSIKTDDKAQIVECTNKGDKKHKTILFYDDKNIRKGFSNINWTSEKIEFEASFPYKDVSLFDFFWIHENKKHLLPLLPVIAHTCRHNHNINLRLYPDIIWELNFFYNTPDPVWYGQSEPVYNMYKATTAVRDTTVLSDVNTSGNRKALADLRREELDKNKAASNTAKKIGVNANNHFGDALSNFGLSAKVSWDQVESQEFSFKIAEKYRQLLGIVKGVYDLVENISGSKEAKKASENLPANLLHRRNLMSFSLLPPAPSVGVSWKYAASSTGIMGVELKGRLKCSPLIGGELKIDILALSEKIPAYGKLITALDIATWLIEKVAMDRLSIDYRIDLTFYANLAIEEAYINYNEAQPKGKKLQTDMVVSGTFGGKLEISFDMKIKVTVKAEAGFEAGIKGDCYFKVTASPNADSDNMVDWTTKFSGLIITGYMKFTSPKNTKKDKPNEFDPFTLIPSYTATPVSMIFGEGKVNKY